MKKEKEETEKEKPRSLEPLDPLGESGPWRRLIAGWPLPWRSRSADEFFRDWPWPGRGRDFLPAMDVSENDEHYTITVELPGTRKDDVHVEFHEGVLTIRGEKSSERKEKKEHSRYVERCYGSFSRSIPLPADADAEHLDASFKDGVLAIAIPRTEKAKPRSIAIKAA